MNVDLSGFGELDISWWDILWAGLSVLAGWIASIFGYRGVLAVMHRTPNVSEGLALFAARFARYSLIILGIGVGVGFVGPSLQPLIAMGLIVAVIAVLVLRGIADNFAAGVLIQTRNPIKVGDEIEHDDLVGTVKELNGRSIVMVTRDGRTVHIPNAKAISDVIINHSEHGARRTSLEVRVRATDAEPSEVASAIVDAATKVEGVHRRETVRALYVTLAAERMIFELQFWHHPLNRPVVASGVVHAVYAAAAERGWPAAVTSQDPVVALTPPDTL